MENVKHTPGPWQVRIDEIFGVEVYPTYDGLDPAFGEWAGLAAVTETFDEGNEEQIANAHLIAAAPDLLEALKDARFALYGNGPGDPKIDAAIAKAMGETKD